MKKTLRMMGLVALAVLALAGCKKDEQTTSSFKATLPQPTSDAKTHIGNGDSLLWNAGDAIKVFDTDGNAYLFTTDDDNKSTATFTGETSLNASNTYTAFYPAANTSDVTNGEILLTLAADQTYVAGGFANGTYPVVAQNEGASFTFDSDCGLLAIPVMGTGNISTIELTGKASENLAGQLRYDLSGHYLGLTNAQTTVTLDCGNLPLSADATTFYFVVPAGVFANGFTAVLKNGATELFTLATTNPNTIVAKRIRQMNPVTVSAITLVTGGGTPANVGYTDATVYGSYVAPTGMGVTEIGFYFGTDASAMTATPVTPIASPFSHTFDGLTAGTTYYYQAYVKNGTNEYLGTVESFTTNVPAATVTTAPTATTGTIYAGSTTPLVSAGVAEGGTMMYMVTTENTKPTSTTGFSATVPTAETLASGTYYVWYYVQGDATHTDSGISDTAITVTVTAYPAATVTTAPTAKTGVTAGQNEAIVSAGVAEGGTMMYMVTTENTKPTSTTGFSATVPTAETLSAGTYYVWYYFQGDATHTDSEISATGIEVTIEAAGPPALTMEALTAGTVVVSNPKSGMQYSLNGGAKTPVTSDAINVTTGDKVAFYGNGTSITNYNGTTINGSGDGFKCKVYGNIMSLIDETGYATLTALPNSQGVFNRLFYGNATLTDASGLLLPATTLEGYCYNEMFKGCTSLTTAPTLPATTLAEGCYYSMFNGCTSLTTAPTLPATTLAVGCYYGMFFGCTSLTTAPVLPATTLAIYCYYKMFENCSSLTAAPTLPATTLVEGCYLDMFYSCTNLSSITCLATAGINQNQSTLDWLCGVASTGTFTKASGATSWPTNSVNGIPSGWTVNEQ